MILRVAPGDVALVMIGGAESDEFVVMETEEYEKIRAMLGLDDPLPVQYLKWLRDVVTLNPGESITVTSGIAVIQLVKERLPVTLQLAAYTLLVAFVISIPLGIISAVRQDTWVDYSIRSVTIFGLAMPNFWVASLFILFLVAWFNWSPPIFYTHLWESPGNHLAMLVWPVLALSWSFSCILTRMTRSAMLEVLRQDYMRTAQAKGLTERVRLFRHGLRNAMLPVLTLMGLQLSGVLAGSVVMETIFGLPGVGSLAIHAIQLRDFAVVQFVITLFVVKVLVVNLVVDMMYGWMDPRIRYA